MHRLASVSQATGRDVWIKRDDLTGFAGGGNKGRKLEYIASFLVESRADTVVTSGALQSNFVRQLGGLCAMLGIRCVAVVMRLPYEEPYGKPCGAPPADGGNVELDRLFGVELELVEDGTWDELFDRAAARVEHERAAGRNVYAVPVGGSTVLGALGFVHAAREVEPGFDDVVVATSSGSTHAGLAWGFAGSAVRVHGIACDPEPDIGDDVARLCGELDRLLCERRSPGRGGILLHHEYVGPGYGVPSEAGEAAQRRLAREEGIVLDPVYSAKAMAGLLGLAERGELGERVLFWHTGGLPGACSPGANAAMAGTPQSAKARTPSTRR